MKTADVVIVCATSQEYAHLAKALDTRGENSLSGCLVSQGSKNATYILTHSMPGKIRTASATQFCIDRFSPTLIIDTGAAGGLIDDIAIGTIVCVDKKL